MRVNENHNPYGDLLLPTGIVAAIGSDVFATKGRKPDGYAPGRKYPITDIGEFRAFQETHGLLHVDPRRIFSGLSGGNLAVGIDKLVSNGSRVAVYTTLSPTDVDSTARIRHSMEVDHNIKLYVKDNVAPDGSFRSNAVSLILPPEGNPVIVGYKPPAPAINVAEFDESPGVLVMAPTSGDWVETTHHSIDYARDNSIPIVIFASESQIKQIRGDERKRQAYLKQLKSASAFIGNYREAAMIVSASRITPSQNVEELTLQLKTVSKGSLTDVSITNGRRGSVYRDVNENLYTLTGPEFPWRGVTPYVNRLGLGDAYAAVLFHALQHKGTDPDNIDLALRKAGYGTALATRAEDAQSPQMTLDEYNQDPPEEFEVDMQPRRSQLFPTPPTDTQSLGA
jgi:sugar/nucleoside kinase (ribokinase family)